MLALWNGNWYAREPLRMDSTTWFLPVRCSLLVFNVSSGSPLQVQVP